MNPIQIALNMQPAHSHIEGTVLEAVKIIDINGYFQMNLLRASILCCVTILLAGCNIGDIQITQESGAEDGNDTSSDNDTNNEPDTPSTIAPEIIQATHQRVMPGDVYRFSPTLKAGDQVTWRKMFGPDDAVVDTTTGEVVWPVPEGQPGESFYVGVRATNDLGYDEDVWIVTVGEGAVKYIPDDYPDVWAAHHNQTGIASGDTLVIRDGTYDAEEMGVRSGDGDMTMPPPGQADAYTTVMAENPGQVTIVNQSWSIAGKFERFGYVAVKGLFIKGGDFGIGTSNDYCTPLCTHHIKISYSGAEGKYVPFGLSHAENILLENVYAFGPGRYKFSVYASNQVIVRRAVARTDLSALVGQDTPFGTYTSYNSDNVHFQNVIDIDSDSTAEPFWPQGQRTGAFWTIRNSADNIRFERAIALNNAMGLGGTYGENVAGEFINLIGWDIGGALPGPENGSAFLTRAHNGTHVNHLTLGQVHAPYYLLNGWGGPESFKNALLYDFTTSSGALTYDLTELAYTNFFDVSDVPNDARHDTNTFQYLDPFTNGLTYLPRIEAESPLASAGENDAVMGANVTHFKGRSGTFYGEPGWDENTDIPMWPFPQEAIIQEKMRQFTHTDDRGTLTGKRGFAAEGTGLYGGPITLTSYIWEYLGNPCPDTICP